MPFVKKALIPPPVEGARKSLTQARQEDRRARQRAEAIALRLDQARDAYTQLHEDCVRDESQDVVEIGHILSRSRETLTGLEASLVIAQQQEVQAAAALADAAKDAQRDVLRTHLTRLGEVGVKVDAIFLLLAQAVDEFFPLVNDTRALGFDLINHTLTKSSLLFKIKLLESCHKMPGCAQAETWFLEPGPFSASLPTVDQADHTR